VLGMSVSYFDTIPPSAKLVLLESGYLFAAGDCSNHIIYRFTSLGGDAKVSTNSADNREMRFCPQAVHQNLEVCNQL
jgi:hypothetical protein